MRRMTQPQIDDAVQVLECLLTIALDASDGAHADFAAAVDRFVGWFRGRFPSVGIELDRRLVRCERERDETDSPAEHDHHHDRGWQEHVHTLPELKHSD